MISAAGWRQAETDTMTRTHERAWARFENLCDDFFPGDDGVDPRFDHRGRARKAGDRKTRQLCRQIARTLDLALAGVTDGPLGEARVGAVLAGADARHVEVTLHHPAPDGAVLDAAARARPWLRREVAAHTHRKRVPELIVTVVAAPAEEVRDV